MKLSSNNASNISAGSVVVSASNAEGVISLEAGARLDANAASTSIRATSQAGINMATDSDSDGSVTVSSGQNVDMEAQHAAQLSASAIRLDSDASTSMQSQGDIMLTSTEIGGSVDVVSQSLTTTNTRVSMTGADDVVVQSGEGTLKLSSNTASNLSLIHI